MRAEYASRLAPLTDEAWARWDALELYQKGRTRMGLRDLIVAGQGESWAAPLLAVVVARMMDRGEIPCDGAAAPRYCAPAPATLTREQAEAAEMGESESYGWAAQALRPIQQNGADAHRYQQVLDLVATAIREAWAHRRASRGEIPADVRPGKEGAK